MSSILMKIMASSVVIANRAGVVIRDIMETGNLGIVNKAEHGDPIDPQTQADRSAQDMIIGSLSKQYPGLCVVGEEECNGENVDEKLLVTDMDSDVLKHECPSEYQDLKMDDIVVWVDPLDGTKEFTEGHVTHVTILIGVSAKGKAIGGVIHQPFGFTNGRTLWGVPGLGMFGTTVASVAPGRRIITTTKSHSTQLVQDAIAALSPDQVIRTGGAGYKVLQVIEGEADAYVFATPGTKKWDSCAPEAVLRACGGTITDICNELVDYSDTNPKHHMNWTGLLATARDHSSFADKIPESIKTELRQVAASKM